MSEERQRGVDLFNEAWRLMESREDDDRLLHVTHASRYHWGEAEECEAGEPRARGEWQISRVYTVLGRRRAGDLACAPLRSSTARRTGSATGTSRTRTEALARAHALAGDERSGVMEVEGARSGRRNRRPEDREHFDEDYATLLTGVRPRSRA